MDIKKITSNITIRPTDRKMKQAKQTAKTIGILPKEMPIEKKYYIDSESNVFSRIKDSIQVAINNMKG